MRLGFLSGSSRSRTVRGVAAGAGILLVGSGLVAVSTQANAAAGCKVDYAVNQWATGFTGNLTITNLGDPITAGWKLEWDYAGDQTITQSWNSTYTQSGKHVTIANADFNKSIATNASVTPGFGATFSGANTAPTAFKLNGVACNGATASPSASASKSTSPSASPSASKSVSPSASASASVSPSASVSLPPVGDGGTANIGWATQSGGTTGGKGATAAHTYTVSTRSQLLAALAGTDPSTGKTNKTAPKIIKWVGSIDMTEGRPFTSHSDQASRGEVKLQPNTTIIGVGANAYLPNGWFKISNINNVIIRNVKITNPCDIAPKWDSGDGAGNYNSEFDGMTIDGSTHVWIDHLWFTDAPYTDDMLPTGNKDKNGVTKRIQCHDGSLDIKNASDFVTVSNTIFEQHEKNSLVGQSDSKTTDIGHQTISFIGNLYRNVGQRSPRVRFGQLHTANNYFVGSKTDPVYPHGYSIGTGIKSQIISDNNVFDIAGAAAGSCAAVVRNPNPDNPEGNFKDTGSTVNGAPLAGCTAPNTVNWTVPYAYPLLPTSQVKASVLANAGTGKI